MSVNVTRVQSSRCYQHWVCETGDKDVSLGRARGTQFPGGGDIELGLRIAETLLGGEGAEKGKMYHRERKQKVKGF